MTKDKPLVGNPDPPATPNLDPVAAAKVNEERQKAEERISKSGGTPPPHGPQAPKSVPLTSAEIKGGKGLKFKNRDGKDSIYKGKGKQSKQVKAYLGGELGAVQVVDYDPATGQEIFPKTKDDSGLPAPGTQEYTERMNFSEQFCKNHLNMLSVLYQKRYNNPMTPEEIDYGVFMTKWVVFKYADSLQNAPEAMAATFIIGNHIQHAQYRSTKTGQLVSREQWYTEQGMIPPKPGIFDKLQIGGGAPEPVDPTGGDEAFRDEQKYAEMASKGKKE